MLFDETRCFQFKNVVSFKFNTGYSSFIFCRSMTQNFILFCPVMCQKYQSTCKTWFSCTPLLESSVLNVNTVSYNSKDWRQFMRQSEISSNFKEEVEIVKRWSIWSFPLVTKMVTYFELYHSHFVVFHSTSSSIS